jgi:membrane-bound lytic murein transglycosylase A
MPSIRTFAGAALGFCVIAAAATPAHSLSFRNAEVHALTFDRLDGWKTDDHLAAFQAFMKSCGAIKHGSVAMRRKRAVYGGLYNACMKGLAAGTLDREGARKFFEDNFKPVRIIHPNQTVGHYTGSDGFYTGYWELLVEGSRKKTDEFTVPLYRTPRGGRSHDRAAIASGALAGKGLEICWIKDPIDGFFAEIQGSMRVRLDTGEQLRLNYAASNGKKYTPVGRILIERGIYTPEEMSMDKIREYMTKNPEEGKALRLMNRSFVYFTETKLKPTQEPAGAQGVPLTAGRSLAVDPSHHVYGTPIWIDARFPINSDVPQDPFQRLMFAQDTGGAIKGPARADIYFGHGEGMGSIAGRIKQFGKFVMLVPKDVSVETTTTAVANATPLPKPRPKEITEAMAAGKKPARPALAGDGAAAPVPAPQR